MEIAIYFLALAAFLGVFAFLGLAAAGFFAALGFLAAFGLAGFFAAFLGDLAFLGLAAFFGDLAFLGFLAAFGFFGSLLLGLLLLLLDSLVQFERSRSSLTLGLDQFLCSDQFYQSFTNEGRYLNDIDLIVSSDVLLDSWKR